MPANALYTDLSSYYDLMCSDINYQEQSECVRRLDQLFGNSGKQYLDLACGTGPHLQHFVEFGYNATGLDINQPMLDIAQERCPNARFIQNDMSRLAAFESFDLVTCFLYSIHYNPDIEKLNATIKAVHAALKPGGIFCFNSVNKNTIDNRDGIKHELKNKDADFVFQSSWRYSGEGDRQDLHVNITRTTEAGIESWHDEHPMVALSFEQLEKLLSNHFEIHIFEHVYDKILPWNGTSGNAIFVCIKK